MYRAVGIRTARCHYRIYKCPIPVLVLSHIDPVHALKYHFLKIHLILSSHLPLDLPSGLRPSGFPAKTLYTSLLFPKRNTFPTRHFLLDLFTRKNLAELYRSLSFSLCSTLHSPVTSYILHSPVTSYILHSPVTSYHLDRNILLNTLLSSTLRVRSSVNVSDQVSHPYKQTGNIVVLYVLIFENFGHTPKICNSYAFPRQ